MVKNDFQRDIKTIMEQQGVSQNDLAKKTGMIQQAVSRAMTGKQFNDSFVKLLDALGYDIKVVYVKQDTLLK